ncbi:MAG: hypothetical protein OEL56_01750 [Nitrosopumilus sp.]|nr:hypothetical protein [Nitrosopumilus sp.]MDH3489151.1 hypothetical protein [Nitrosopumilus sp.]MDH3516150.1 hypothetical protein [Nitrosopumilus sp.]MDH3565425.1 hypothetical protein [Nitrosopumilus sp.]MDH5417049.1 hypothetical protein [Nitrosopumilus sp.]
MINPELIKLLETNNILDILRESVVYQLQKIHSVEKTNEGRDWYQELPAIVRTKFDCYKADYENLSRILNSEYDQMMTEMNKGYYYWRLVRSACNTYQNDLVEYDQQLNQEFNMQKTEAISDNTVLHECIGVLDQHAIDK